MGGGGSGGVASDRRCQQLVSLTIRAIEAATAEDCITLANADAEVCAIDPAFLAKVYVARVDGASCRQPAEVIRQCANGANYGADGGGGSAAGAGSSRTVGPR